MPDELLEGLFTAIDAMDTERFTGFLTDDVRFRFGSAPPVAGREAVREAVDGFFATIDGLTHRLKRIIVDGSTLVCTGDVTYTRKNRSKITLPFANVFELRDGRIADYTIYADLGPLYAA